MLDTWRNKTSGSVQSVQNKLGNMRKRAPADKHDVAMLVQEYEDAEKVITKVIEDAMHLQTAWNDMAVHQVGTSKAFHELYAPMIPDVDETEERRNTPVITPGHQLDRTSNFEHICSGLHDEMRDEIAAIETLLLQPATDVKESIQPIKKTIKKRDKARIDFENAQCKVTKLQMKSGKSVKDETQLEKARFDLSVYSEAFEIADSHLRETLPPLVQAVSSIIPHLLASIILIQNRLLGLCYTIMHEYCQENDFPSPAPGMNVVVAEWEQAFQPVVSEVESFALLRKYAVLNRRTDTERPAVRRVASYQRVTAPLSRISSASSQAHSPSITLETGSCASASPSIPSQAAIPSTTSVPTDFTTATVLRGQRSMQSLGPQPGDYFGQNAVIAKKKPPPPPPGPKPRMVVEFVEAQYDFNGEGEGDLSFRAGDRIRVIQKTQTDQDWWQGEIGGYQGSFPANYCRPIASN